MHFDISDELNAVRDSLSRVLADHYTDKHRQGLSASASAYAQEAWSGLAELGLAGLAVPEAFGGFGAPATDLLPVFHELGRALAPVPFLGSCVLGAAALRHASDVDAAQKLLPAIAAGELQVACEHVGPQASCTLRAEADGQGWRLEGEARHLPYAASADWLILRARTGGESGSGEGLFLLAANTKGVQLRAHRLVDGTPAADVRLEGVVATALCAPGSTQAQAAGAAMAAAGIAAACGEMVGAMDAALRLTLDYLKTRKQFGRLIGENQALRHRTADMLVYLEMARSLSIAAAVAADRPGQAGAWADLHRAKFLVGRNARNLCQQAIQLHGGIGMTEEYAVGHYLRRVHVLDQQFGEGAWHLEALGRLA